MMKRRKPEIQESAARPRPLPRLALAGEVEAALGPDALALPTEHALLLRVALPLPSHRQRLAAVGFAVEDLIAEPLEASHVALGPELAPGEYLAMVVREADMAAWGARARDAGLRLVPDALGLPVPAEGGLSVREAGARVLARRADGTGFATDVGSFETFWRAEGAPQIVLFGGRLADGLPVSAAGLLPAEPSAATLRTDLLQGRHARADGQGHRLLVRLAVVAGLALAAHGAILAADALALTRIADAREAELRTALAARVPGLDAGLPLDAALRRAFADGPAAGGAFLPLLSRISEVLAPLSGAIAMRDLAFDGAGGSLAVSLEAADLATLQRIEQDLRGAGLGVTPGVATTGDGAAQVRYVIAGAAS